MGRTHVGRITWLWGVILVLAGCASSDPVVMRSLPLAGEAPRTGTSIQEVSLQEAGVPNRDDRLFMARVGLKNRTGKALQFGPHDVFVADAGATLLYRISERWLSEYYTTRSYGKPAVADRKAIAPYSSTEMKLGDATYAAPPSSAAQRDSLATEIAELVEEIFVRPQEDGPRTFLERAPEVTLGTLVQERTLQPGDGVSGFVYFYRPATQSSPYPLQVVIKLESEIHTFAFRE